MKHLLYTSFSRIGGDQLFWRLDSNRLRILCYHGICEDGHRDDPWVPSFFVTRSAFDRQLQYLSRNAEVLPLHEAVQRLRKGSLPARSVSITFDDGYANNLHLAWPLLQKYAMPATIFVSSAYIESGDMFPFLKLKLIRLYGGSDSAADALPDYKSSPIDTVIEQAERGWREVKPRLEEYQRQTLRPLTIEELRALDSKLIDFGGHCHTHCILRNENRVRRESEIHTSIGKVAEWTGRRSQLFSYPNGEAGDFDETDKDVLRAEGIDAAVTGIGGANDAHTDPLELKRYPLTLRHDDAGFSAEVTGFRHLVHNVGGRFSG